MLKTVQSYIEKHKMIEKGDLIIVGISGGADSVCLFHVLLALRPIYNLTLYGVHINHGIRGHEADLDENFVKELCLRNGVAFTGVFKDIPLMAKENGMSLEEAGRKARYDVFYECMENNKCNKIAIAHNKNDDAETILFHLFRGSGLHGLTGIKPVREEIIRPLLCVERKEIEDFLRENQIHYRNDSTNSTLDYSRNIIRHEVLKVAAQSINLKAVDHITRAGEQLNDIADYLDCMIYKSFQVLAVKKGANSFAIDLNLFLEENIVIRRGIIRKVFSCLAGGLKDFDAFHTEMVLDLCEKEVGKSINLPMGLKAIKGYDEITIKVENVINKPENSNEIKIEMTEKDLQIPGETRITIYNKPIQTKLINYKKNMIIPKNGYTKWFDYDKIKNTVRIRTRKEGDFIQIDEKGSSKKLKSLFIDEKIPRERRDFIPLIADGSHIMWVIGGRMSEAYKVDDNTNRILEINVDGGKEDE